MSQYLLVPQYAVLTLLPSIRIEDLQTTYGPQVPGGPTWLDNTLIAYSDTIDIRLRKRYVAPFLPPYNPQLQLWLRRLVDPVAYQKLGIDASDKQIDTLIEDAKAVLLELKEAADAQNGLYDLPLRADAPGESGIVSPKILSRSDPTPYDWMYRQAARANHG